MKLNQFAVYRVNQQTEGKALWHMLYQEAIHQKILIRVEYYRQMSIEKMQKDERATDIIKWMKKELEVSDVLVLNHNGEISCYYIDEDYPQYLAGFIRMNTSGALITMDTDNYQIEGKKGNWNAYLIHIRLQKFQIGLQKKLQMFFCIRFADVAIPL